MAAQIGQQSTLKFRRQRADFPQKCRARQHREKTQPNNRCRLESAGRKLRVSGQNGFIKVRHALVKLGADAANKEITEGRQSPEQNNRTVFNLAVSPGQRH